MQHMLDKQFIIRGRRSPGQFGALISLTRVSYAKTQQHFVKRRWRMITILYRDLKKSPLFPLTALYIFSDGLHICFFCPSFMPGQCCASREGMCCWYFSPVSQKKKKSIRRWNSCHSVCLTSCIFYFFFSLNACWECRELHLFCLRGYLREERVCVCVYAFPPHYMTSEH